MKIAWLCNTLIGEVSQELNLTIDKPESWIKGLLEKVVCDNEVELLYLFPCNRSDIVYVKGNVTFCGFRQKKIDIIEKEMKEDIKNRILDFKPDVIHIHGSEFPHAYALYEVCKELGIEKKVVVSIQGLVHMCARHYYACLPWKTIVFPTFRDIYRKQGMIQQKKNFYRRGRYEVRLLSEVENVIGRTEWDLACLKRINAKSNYYFCNEILRDSFYQNEKWSVQKCEKHSIFVSQSNYPIKGFHLILEAFAEILKKYPDAHLYTTGDSPYADTAIKRVKQQSYKKYLSMLINKYDLQDHISFLGYLDENEMRKQYLKANVFISASSIENSPNSVGEAMILGVPVVSSDVGGVKNLLTHKNEGYIFPSDEPYMITFYVERVFECLDNINDMSEKAIKYAKELYDRERNYNVLLSIYNDI